MCSCEQCVLARIHADPAAPPELRRIPPTPGRRGGPTVTLQNWPPHGRYDEDGNEDLRHGPTGGLGPFMCLSQRQEVPVTALEWPDGVVEVFCGWCGSAVRPVGEYTDPSVGGA